MPAAARFVNSVVDLPCRNSRLDEQAQHVPRSRSARENDAVIYMMRFKHLAIPDRPCRLVMLEPPCGATDVGQLSRLRPLLGKQVNALRTRAGQRDEIAQVEFRAIKGRPDKVTIPVMPAACNEDDFHCLAPLDIER